ncbi:MAG: ABC transporter permease [Candidatus Gastranaerophilales bacterium]|nr:ABC transporter permease [Candidatus Gastranaerophilales bacterium]
MIIYFALIKKEFLQIIRDSSSILIAFVLPLIILVLYRYGVNLDTVKITLGIKNDDINPKISTLINSFNHSKYIKTKYFDDKEKMYGEIRDSKLKGAVVFPNDFTTRLLKNDVADVLVITDGSEANMANFTQSYVTSIVNAWLYEVSDFKYQAKKPLVSSDIRMWYNQDINSHHFILPGSLAITMNLIGMLLTALVIAREWERGTIESLFSTSISKLNFIVGKYIPYFTLGFCSFIFNVLICIFIFQIPFRGNIFILLFVGALYLFSCLGIGLLISSSFKEQFSASQTALSFGLLPAMLLSGLIYPISSMPIIFQYLTMLLPPRYFITFIQSEFMAGTIVKIVLINSLYLSVLGLILFFLVYRNINLRLEKCKEE